MGFWRLLVGTVVMLAAGYAGESGQMNAGAGFAFGMAGWGYILYEIFQGEAGSVAGNDEKVSEHVRTSFSTMRFIVTVGWSIYPLGYFFGYLMGSVQDSVLNLCTTWPTLSTRSPSALQFGHRPNPAPWKAQSKRRACCQ